MSNVVSITTRQNTAIKENEQDEAQLFISNFYDWAVEKGIDTTTTEFKWDAATVMTIVKGLIHKNKD